MTVGLRAARAADTAAINDLVERAYAHYVPRIGLRPAPMDDDHTAHIAAGMSWVAAEGAAVVGVLELATDLEDSTALMVLNIGVDPGRQGEGIGARLLELAAEQARQRGLSRLRLYTHVLMTENQRFYAARGWELLQRRTDHGVERFYYGRSVHRR